MGKKACLEIQQDYSLYSELVNNQKSVEHSPVTVNKKKLTHPTYITGEVSGTHETVKCKIKFEVEVKIYNEKNFKFKLFTKQYFPVPIFRYDSYGLAHRNNDPSIPLRDQQVLTPHFHKFNEQGFEIAYKTEFINAIDKQHEVEDINKCLRHFCDEGNLRFKSSEYITVQLNTGELEMTHTNEDPLQNINFE